MGFKFKELFTACSIYFLIDAASIALIIPMAWDSMVHMPDYGERKTEDAIGVSISFVILITFLIRAIIILILLIRGSDKPRPSASSEAFKPERILALALLIIVVAFFPILGTDFLDAGDENGQLSDWVFLLLLGVPLVEAWSGSFGKLWGYLRVKNNEVNK